MGNSTATVTPYDANNLEVPRAMGGTCYAMALMLAYNQFSSNTSLQTFNPGQPAGDAGGNGRQGAQKIIIFETDGAPNTTASASFVNNGAYQSYYKVRYNSSNPRPATIPTNVTRLQRQRFRGHLADLQHLHATWPPRLPPAGTAAPATRVLIHCLAFGPQGLNGLPTLNQMQQIGNVNDGMPSYKIINGNSSTRSSPTCKPPSTRSSKTASRFP